jgi:hypothetical protein
MNKILTLTLGMTLLASMGTFAQADCEQCGTLPPPPPPVSCTIRGNAGVGNGGDQIARTEYKDCDPGNSGAHNQAWKNADKPRSSR